MDVVITDIVMPGMDGMDLVKKIKTECASEVIVITGYTSSYSFDEVIEKGADDFLEKPLKGRELVLRIKRVLKMRAILAEKDKTEKILKDREIQLRKIGQRTGRAEEEIRKNLASE